MSERHIVVSYTPGSPIGLRVMPPDSDRPVGDSEALREAADMLAPTEDPAPSQDTLRAVALRGAAGDLMRRAETWGGPHPEQRGMRIAATLLDRQADMLAATTPEATGRDGVPA